MECTTLRQILYVRPHCLHPYAVRSPLRARALRSSTLVAVAFLLVPQALADDLPSPAAEAPDVIKTVSSPEALRASAAGRASSPVEWGRVASGFGFRAGRRGRHRRRQRRQFHAGLDFASPHGTPVLAARSGIVSHIAVNHRKRNGFTGYGNTVVVFHPPRTPDEEPRWSMYAHLSEMFVAEGMLVRAGEKLGLVGNTSNRKFPSMASHLHFEVRRGHRDGSAPFPAAYRAYNVDPLPWLVKLGVPLGPRREVGLTFQVLLAEADAAAAPVAAERAAPVDHRVHAH